MHQPVNDKYPLREIEPLLKNVSNQLMTKYSLGDKTFTKEC